MIPAMASPITDFIKHHYRHFNAAALVAAAEDYVQYLAAGNKMLLTMAGGVSPGETAPSLAERIRRDKVHAIVCTGANLEEDIFNLVAHECYERVPHYRQLRAEDEQALLERHMNRVTDTCIPEGEAMRRIESAVLRHWMEKDKAGKRLFPHEFMYEILRDGSIAEFYQIDRKNWWMIAAAEKNLPMFVPGWEDSTLGNMYTGHCITGDVGNVHTVRTGIEYMIELADYYTKTSSGRCCTRTCSGRTFRCGATFARSRTPRPATARTPAPCRTRRSRGGSSASTRRSTSSSRTRRSWRRWCSRTFWGGSGSAAVPAAGTAASRRRTE